MTSYNGSCHCGSVKYRVNLDLSKPVFECNCSHCQRKGFLLSFVPATEFTLLTGEENMTEYRFYTHRLRHLFCQTCGVQCYCEGEHEGNPTRAINVRTIEDINLSKLERQAVDGKSF